LNLNINRKARVLARSTPAEGGSVPNKIRPETSA